MLAKNTQIEAAWAQASRAYLANGVIPPVGAPSHGATSTTHAPSETTGTRKDQD